MVERRRDREDWQENCVRQEEGTPQGGSISPMLANIYLHYVLDLWADHWRKTRANGDVIIVRYADDFVVGFQHQSDARRFLDELRERFRRFGLELHADKTRVIEFGRFAAEPRRARPRQAGDLQLSGLYAHLRQDPKGMVRRAPANDPPKRMRAKLVNLKEALRPRSIHLPVPEVGRWLNQVLRGHYQYYGVPRNYRALELFRDHVRQLWHRALNRRSQKGRINEAAMNRIAMATGFPNRESVNLIPTCDWP